MKRFSDVLSFRERYGGGVCVLGLLLLVGYLSLHWQYTVDNIDAKAAAQNHQESVYSKISEISGVTSSLQALYRITADVGSEELSRFTDDVIDVTESIESVSRFDRIKSADFDAFSSLMTEQGIYQFTLKKFTKDGSVAPAALIHEANAIVGVSPFTPVSARLIGVDISNDEFLGTRLATAVDFDQGILSQYPTGWPSSGDVVLLLPTYTGRYSPESTSSRRSQSDGGYLLELSFEHFLTETDLVSSEILLPGRRLSSAINVEKETRIFKGLFEGYQTHLRPLIGVTPIDIIISAQDGVSVRAVVNAVILMLGCLFVLALATILLLKTRYSEVDRRSAQESLDNERQIALTTLEAINDSVFTLGSDGSISYVNPAAEKMIRQSSSVLIGKHLNESIPVSSHGSQAALREIEEGLLAGESTRFIEMELSESAAATQIDCTFTPFGDQNSSLGGVLVMRDVGQERALNRKLKHLATHDSLTGLVNRYLFEIRLEELVQGAKIRGESHAICYIDLDQFKVVNDTCGHTAGDKLLVQVANNLKDNCRQNDILARLGGDEFGLLITNCSEEECENIARRLHEVFQSFFFISGEHKFAIRACFGFVPINSSYDAVSDVLAAADLACYSAKDKGRNEIHVFRLECEETLVRQDEMLMLPKLQNALAVDRFVLFVQPIAEILEEGIDDTGKYEILLRMEDDDGSLITPFRLISAAERYDLMKEIDRWVINRAFHEIAELQTLYGEQLPMFSINLSGQSATDVELIGYILGKVAQTGVPTEKICFEITETSAMVDLSRAMVLLEFLHNLGCKLALDDFGAGECSFGYLKNLPVDYLKVDGQFVKDVDTCEVHKEMLRFVQRVAKLLDMKTVAEFVENESILDTLREMKIDFAQGYHISKPFHISELKQLAGQKKAA